MLKSGLPQVVGRTITAVVVKTGRAPEWQLYLLLNDGAWYELYGDGYLGGASDLDTGDLTTVEAYMERTHKTILQVVLDDPTTEGVDVN